MPVGSDDPDGPSDKHGWRRLGARLTGARGLLRAAIPVVVVALILGGMGVAFAAHVGPLALPRTADSGVMATATRSSAETSTAGGVTPIVTTPGASVTATASTHASAGSPVSSSSGATSSSMPQSAPTPTAFHLQSVTVTAAPSDNFTHTCSAVVNESFTMTITAEANPSGETISYGWYDPLNIGTTNHVETLTFAPGEMSKTVTFQMGFSAGHGDGSAQHDTAWVTYPDSWLWPPTSVTHATVAYTCVRQLTSFTLTPSITAWNAPCAISTPITMTWTVVASPGPSLTVDFSPYTQSDPAFDVWLAPNAFQAILPPTSSLGESTTQASGSVTTGLNTSEPNGTYWMQLATTAPQALTAKATVVKSC